MSKLIDGWNIYLLNLKDDDEKNGTAKDAKEVKSSMLFLIGNNIFWLNSHSINLYCDLSKLRKRSYRAKNARTEVK